MTDPIRREQAVVALLNEWPWDIGGTIIGGYAVAAYGHARYSDDLDIVIPISALVPLKRWLEEEGFESVIYPDDIEFNYAGKVPRWQREDITIDLLPGVVRDRKAKVDITEDWLTRDVRSIRLTTRTSATSIKVPVVRPEAIWALKLQAGRLQDLSDLFAIQDTPIDPSEVLDIYKQLWCESMAAKLKIILARLDEPKTYADILSRLERGSPDWKRNQTAWRRFRGMVRRCLPEDSDLS